MNRQPKAGAEVATPATPASNRDVELAELAKALGHPARVHIVRLLAAREGCICGEIVEVVGLAQSTVSQHLKVLKEAGLVQGEVDGPRVCYCLDAAVLDRLATLVAGLVLEKSRGEKER